MEVKGVIHCLFEQSGTFKKEFQKLGYVAYDYDIQNEFAETDFQIDLFTEIEKAYDSKESVFDSFKPEDLLIAFFPCIYFTTLSFPDFALCRNGTKNKPLHKRIEYAIDKLQKRTYFHTLLYKLVAIADIRHLRLIIENPATQPHYLISIQNFPPPTIIDKNRMERGDFFRKPTAYWFFNCEPAQGFSYQNDKNQRIVLKSKTKTKGGMCNLERSLISSDYARNWICDFILGVDQHLENTFDFGD